MAETLVKEKVCRACGADVRPQALFCYNCGSAVAPDLPLTENNKKKNKKAWVRDAPVADDFAEIDSEIAKIEEKPVGTGVKKDTGEISELRTREGGKKNEGTEKRDLSKMKSAASLRRRGKSVQKKRVEIVWEEHDNAPNGWFIFFAVVLTILAIVIWVISTYLE